MKRYSKRYRKKHSTRNSGMGNAILDLLGVMLAKLFFRGGK